MSRTLQNWLDRLAAKRLLHLFFRELRQPVAKTDDELLIESWLWYANGSCRMAEILMQARGKSS